MAGADYKSCDVCSAKTFYDANLDYEQPTKEMMADKKYDWWLHGIGDWKVICPKCAETMKVIIVPKDQP